VRCRHVLPAHYHRDAARGAATAASWRRDTFADAIAVGEAFEEVKPDAREPFFSESADRRNPS
jgi:hypothetical protein